jgi:hypothetical protein
VFIRSFAFASVLTVITFSTTGFGAASGAAQSPVIGIVSASGHFTLDRAEVWGNATLFDGAKIETGSASSEAALRNGVRIQLGSGSSASIGQSRLTLVQGVGQVAAPDNYEISAGDIFIRSAAGSSRMRVAWIANGALEVTTLSGAARVMNRSGLRLASIPAGGHMSFAMQAPSGRLTRTGCLLSKDGRYLIQDQNTQEILEVRGDGLAANVGNRVTITGLASVLRPALPIATGILNATTITQQEAGGCLSVAAALGAQTEPPGAAAAAPPTVAPEPTPPTAPPASTPPSAAPHAGLSKGAKIAIGVAAAGGGAGAAIALASGKKSTSP